MARLAKSLSFSVLPDDEARWARIQARRRASRSDLLRHAMELLEAEDIAMTLADLQDAGDEASARAGIGSGEALEVIRAHLEAPGYEPSEKARRIVERFQDRVAAPPQRVRSGRVIEQVERDEKR